MQQRPLCADVLGLRREDLGVLERTRQVARDLKGLRSGTLSLASQPGLATYALPPIIARLLTRWPDGTVRFITRSSPTVRDLGRIEAFGAALPRLRRRLRKDLALAGFPRRKVAAMVVAVMADTLVRIGNAGYARDNRSYGLTTLRNRHVRFLRDGRARLQFRGKGGVDHDIALDDRRLAGLLRHCQQLPGQHLFQYRDDDGAVQPVDSRLVNDYLREAMGEAFTAKDFRTWGGTLAAIRLLAEMPWDEAGASQRAMASMRKAVETDVARQLGNTPAVCRKSYIDPRVYRAWERGWLARASAGVRGPRQWEALALKLLRRRSK